MDCSSILHNSFIFLILEYFQKQTNFFTFGRQKTEAGEEQEKPKATRCLRTTPWGPFWQNRSLHS